MSKEGYFPPEQYKLAKNPTSKQVMDQFTAHSVWEYIVSSFEAPHTTEEERPDI